MKKPKRVNELVYVAVLEDKTEPELNTVSFTQTRASFIRLAPASRGRNYRIAKCRLVEIPKKRKVKP